MEWLGFGAIHPSAGMAAMGALLRSGRQPVLEAAGGLLPPSVVASVFYWDRLKSRSPLFAELQQQPNSSCSTTAAGSPAAAVTTESASSAAPSAGLTAAALQAAVTAAVVAVLGSDPGTDTPLVGAGIDSLGELCSAGQGLAEACSTLQQLYFCLKCSPGAALFLTRLMTMAVLPCRRCGAAQRDWPARWLRPARHPRV